MGELGLILPPFLSSDFSKGGGFPYKEKLSSLFLGFMTHPNVRVLPEGCQSPCPFRFHGSISCKKSWGLGRHDDTYLISMVLLTIAAFSLKNLETVAAGMGISQEVWMETVWLIFPRVISSWSAPPVSSCSNTLFTNFLKGTVTQNIFSLNTSPIGCIDLWNDSGLQKLP